MKSIPAPMTTTTATIAYGKVVGAGFAPIAAIMIADMVPVPVRVVKTMSATGFATGFRCAP